MGIKKRVQRTTERVTVRLKQLGVTRRLTSPGAASQEASRSIEWIYLLAIYILMAGVLNAINNLGTPGLNLETIVPNSTVQNVTETFIDLFGYIVGALGIYALYLSGRQTIRARSAEIFFIAGIGLVAVAITLGYYILYAKGG